MSTRAAADAWALRWRKAGAVPIPLQANGKRPLAAWLQVPELQQWAALDAQQAANVGLALGTGGHVVIDADEHKQAGTVANVEQQLAGLGLLDVLPIERTPSGGRHYHLRLGELPGAMSVKLLAPMLGAGELRASRCYVAATPSIVDGRSYEFMQGAPETLPELQIVRWRDVAWLLPAGDGQRPAGDELPQDERELLPPVRLLERGVPLDVWQLLEQLREAQRGDAVGKYASTSQAEAAIVAKCILAGLPEARIAELFDRCQPAHYRALRSGRQRVNYKRAIYCDVLAHLAANETRQHIAAAWRTVEQAASTSEAGEAERRVLLAMLAQAWHVDALQFYASRRDVALHAQLGQSLVDLARQRLQAAHVLRVRRPALEDRQQQANYYRLDAGFLGELAAGRITEHSGQRLQIKQGAAEHLPQGVNVYTGPLLPGTELQPGVLNLAGPVWSRQHAGAAARRVYAVLGSAAQPVPALAAAAGLSVRWAARALLRLAAHGLAVQLAEAAPAPAPGRGRPARKLVAYWMRGAADVLQLASRLEDVSAAGRVEREREAWRSKAKQTPRKRR